MYLLLLGQQSWLCHVLFGSLFSPAATPQNCQRGFSLKCSDFCPLSRGVPVLTDIDLSVSARHRKTRVLVRSCRLPRVPCAAYIPILFDFVVIVIGLRHDLLVVGDRDRST